MEIDVSKLKVFFKKNICNHCKDTLDCDCEQCPKYDEYKKAEKIIAQLQHYKELCEQKTVDNFDLMSQIDKLKAETLSILVGLR